MDKKPHFFFFVIKIFVIKSIKRKSQAPSTETSLAVAALSAPAIPPTGTASLRKESLHTEKLPTQGQVLHTYGIPESEAAYMPDTGGTVNGGMSM